MPTIGDEIGLRELQARWAYSELVSPRFIAACVGFADFPELFDKARKGFAFENLTKEEVRVLVGYERHRAHGSGRPCGFVEKHKSFICESWNRQQIGAAITIVVDPSGNRRSLEALANSSPFEFQIDLGDARIAALLVPDDEEWIQSEPVPVVPIGPNFPVSGCPRTGWFLVDGYRRSLLFWRSQSSSLMVWAPQN